MTTRFHIADPSSGRSAAVTDGIEEHALVVATRPLKQYENVVTFFSSEENGIDMNKDASAGGTPDKVHDGTDSVLWTASSIVGGVKFTFDSTDQNHTISGTKSILSDNSPVGDVFQLTKGSTVTMSNYVSITMWIYVDKDWAAGDNIEMYGWDTALGTIVGNPVGLQDYFSWFSFGSWHKLTIPLTEFGDASVSNTLDSFRIGIVAKDGKSPKFYIDDIQIEQTGSAVEYTVRPERGSWLYVTDYTIVAVDAISSTLALAYDKILGETLAAGINYRRVQGNEVKFNIIINDLANILGLPNAFMEYGGDGTNTWIMVKIKHPEPILLKPEDEDRLSLVIAENLTGLLQLRVSVGGRKEYRKIT